MLKQSEHLVASALPPPTGRDPEAAVDDVLEQHGVELAQGGGRIRRIGQDRNREPDTV